MSLATFHPTQTTYIRSSKGRLIPVTFKNWQKRATRAGRKAKAGPRYPSGKRIPDKPSFRIEDQPHRAWLPERLRGDPRAEHELGILNLRGKISAQQYDAGQRYAQQVGLYLQTINAPMRYEKSSVSTMLPSGRKHVTDDEARRAKLAYNDAFEALITNAGERAARVVAHVAVHGRKNDDLDRLRSGLTALAIHYGLIDGRKIGVDEPVNLIQLPK